MFKKVRIANTITILRLALILLINYLLMINSLVIETVIVVFALWIINIIGDILDGYFARLLNDVTKLGAFLDVFADGILVLGAYNILAFKGIIEYYIVSLVVILYIQFILSSIYIKRKTEHSVKPVLIYDAIGHSTAILIQGAMILYTAHDAITFKVFHELLNYINLLIVIMCVMTLFSRFLLILNLSRNIYYKSNNQIKK